MKFQFHKYLLVLSVAAAAAFSQSGCRENTLINSKVSPSANAVGVWDTILPCTTGSFYDDTLVTSGNPVVAVGTMNDSYFGNMDGAAYFQVVPANPVTGLFTSIDSAFLVMPYSGFTYGDTADQTATQSYQVYYVEDTLAMNTPYQARDTKPNTQELSDGPATVNLYHLKDSLVVGGINRHPGVRIKLNAGTLFGKLNQTYSRLSASSAPIDFFKGDFKGICVRSNATTPSKAIPYFIMKGDAVYSQASITVFYHTSARPDSAVMENIYFSASNCAIFNNIKKNNSGYPAALRNADNDTAIAMQNLPGMSLNIRIPGISKLPRGLINNAILEIPVLPYGNDGYQAPGSIYPVGIGNGTYPVGTASGIAYNVADRYPLGSVSAFAIIDGTPHTITRGNKTVQAYTIGIPREVMSSISAKNDVLHLNVVGSSAFMGAYHLVAGGGNHPDTLYRTRLKVVYSSLNK